MTEGESILEAIIAEPDCDMHRLVYADWMEDQGETARAESIRCDQRTAFLMIGRLKPFDGRPCGRFWASNQGMSLSEDACHAAIGSLGNLDWPAHTEVIFRRGFVEKVVTTAAGWGQHGRAICAGHPVTRVELTDKKPAVLGVNFRPAATAPCFGWRVGFNREGFRGFETVPHLETPNELIPREVFDLLDEFDEIEGSFWRTYATETIALDALSRALIAWARKPVEVTV